MDMVEYKRWLMEAITVDSTVCHLLSFPQREIVCRISTICKIMSLKCKDMLFKNKCNARFYIRKKNK